MEIDVSELKTQRLSLILPLVIVGLIVLGWLGWSILPDGRVLTWTEWQVFKQRRAYRHEVQVLARDADRLAELLNQSPDPVRASLVVEGVYRDVDALTVPSLGNAAGKLLRAADAVEGWALGSQKKEAAMKALETAQKAVSKAMKRYNNGSDE